jgi:hypothetical protein
LTQDVSFKLPALTQSRVGRDTTSEKFGEPQAPQKCRYTGSPLLPVSSNTDVLPAVNVSNPLGTPALTENVVPDCLWQWAQLHSSTTNGSASAWHRISPQRQLPSIFLAANRPG